MTDNSLKIVKQLLRKYIKVETCFHLFINSSLNILLPQLNAVMFSCYYKNSVLVIVTSGGKELHLL